MKKTFFKELMANGNLDARSFRFWSWGQDIKEFDVMDTTSNCIESINSRLNRSVPTSYQKIESSLKHIWDNHKRVLDSYCSQFNYGTTPSRKRKKTTSERWVYLTEQCEQFHLFDNQTQIDDLIPYLIRCAADTPEPSDASEIDPSCDLSK